MVLLEAVNDVAEVQGPLVLAVLVGPALDARLVERVLFERVQEGVDLLLDVLARLRCLPVRWEHSVGRNNFDSVRQNVDCWSTHLRDAFIYKTRGVFEHSIVRLLIFNQDMLASIAGFFKLLLLLEKQLVC